MLGRKINRLAPVILVLALVGCDRSWRMDATLSVDVRDAELREWLQDSHVEFWGVYPGDGLPAYNVGRPDEFALPSADDPGDLLPLFDGPPVRSVKWNEQEGVLSARFTNCYLLEGVLSSPKDYRPIFRIVPVAGDAKVLFLGQNKENEAVWAVAEKVAGASGWFFEPSISPDTLIGWDGEHHYELVGPRWYASMKLTHEVKDFLPNGYHVTFHVQIPHPDIPEGVRKVE